MAVICHVEFLPKAVLSSCIV